MHVQAGKDGGILHYKFLILNPSKTGRTRLVSLQSWTFDHFGLKINWCNTQSVSGARYYQPDTRHHKASKAAFLGQSWSHWLFTHYVSFALFPTHTHIWTDVLCMVRGRFALSYRVRTKQLWSRSILGLLMDLLPFSSGARLAEWSPPLLNLITIPPSRLHCL